MSLQMTPNGERAQIVLFGRRNAGKSSFFNALTDQPLAVVSDVPGTTTDPVSKAMEILPVGPCMITDTPGLDDEGELGEKRVKKALFAAHRADLALIVVDITALTREDLESRRGLPETETALVQKLEERKLPFFLLLNQADRMDSSAAEERRQILSEKYGKDVVFLVSAEKKEGIREVKEALIRVLAEREPGRSLVADLMEPGDVILLVVPIDASAPKGRLILPQQQVIRDILDHHGMAVVTQVEELGAVLERFAGQVSLVITDSQAFHQVAELVPEEVSLTSFSILFARYKGELKTLIQGVKAVHRLEDGDRILIAEGCTHHRQCEDIGTVKIPGLLRGCTGKELLIETSSGTGFPEDLSRYAMVIHCGGCTLPEKEMKYRIRKAGEEKIPIVNYGILLAYMNGILNRSIACFDEYEL